MSNLELQLLVVYEEKDNGDKVPFAVGVVSDKARADAAGRMLVKDQNWRYRVIAVPFNTGSLILIDYDKHGDA